VYWRGGISNSWKPCGDSGGETPLLALDELNSVTSVGPAEVAEPAPAPDCPECECLDFRLRDEDEDEVEFEEEVEIEDAAASNGDEMEVVLVGCDLERARDCLRECDDEEAPLEADGSGALGWRRSRSRGNIDSKS